MILLWNNWGREMNRESNKNWTQFTIVYVFLVALILENLETEIFIHPHHIMPFIIYSFVNVKSKLPHPYRKIQKKGKEKNNKNNNNNVNKFTYVMHSTNYMLTKWIIFFFVCPPWYFSMLFRTLILLFVIECQDVNDTKKKR